LNDVQEKWLGTCLIGCAAYAADTNRRTTFALLAACTNWLFSQSVNQFICPQMQYTLDRTPREHATSANRCP